MLSCAAFRRTLAERRQADGDRGMTLVELLVASALLIGLLTIVAISLQAFMAVGNQVQASYNNTNSIIPSATTLQRLIRTMVEPGPPSATSLPSTPSPMFKTNAQTSYSATFYSNVGSSLGPAQIVASVTGTTFTVTEQLPTTGASPAVCPFSNTDVTDHCNYPASGKVLTLVSIPYVQNVVTGTPVFTYTLLDPNYTNPQTFVPATVFTTCTATSVGTLTGTGTRESATCPGDVVQGVEVNLQIKSPGSVQTTQDTVVYRLSATSQVYDPTVG